MPMQERKTASSPKKAESWATMRCWVMEPETFFLERGDAGDREAGVDGVDGVLQVGGNGGRVASVADDEIPEIPVVLRAGVIVEGDCVLAEVLSLTFLAMPMISICEGELGPPR